MFVTFHEIKLRHLRMFLYAYIYALLTIRRRINFITDNVTFRVCIPDVQPYFVTGCKILFLYEVL